MKIRIVVTICSKTVTVDIRSRYSCTERTHVRADGHWTNTTPKFSLAFVNTAP